MTDRPIIFSAPMVRALLAGRKSQTRRLATSPLRLCRPSDRLWVKETHTFVGSNDPGFFITRADYPGCVPYHVEGIPPSSEVRWRPSIHMPRRLSRITLVVTAVRAQWLQDITDEDALAEGVDLSLTEKARDQYRTLWNSLHGPKSWDSNPEIVALTFDVLRRNIDKCS